jgi:hypothetical protein
LGFGLGLFEGEGLGDLLGLGLGLGLGLAVELELGDGLGLVPDGLLLGVGLVLTIGLRLGDGLPLDDGPGLDGGLAFADGLPLGDALALGLVERRIGAWPRAAVSWTPEIEFVLTVSAGRAPQGDFALGEGTVRVPARATPNILHERMEIPANVLSAIAPACRLLTGTAAPRWTSPRGLVCSP